MAGGFREAKTDEGYAWVVVFASFWGSFLSLGSVYSLGGTFFLAWRDEWPDVARKDISPVISLVFWLTFGFAPFSLLIAFANANDRNQTVGLG